MPVLRRPSDGSVILTSSISSQAVEVEHVGEPKSRSSSEKVSLIFHVFAANRYSRVETFRIASDEDSRQNLEQASTIRGYGPSSGVWLIWNHASIAPLTNSISWAELRKTRIADSTRSLGKHWGYSFADTNG